MLYSLVSDWALTCASDAAHCEQKPLLIFDLCCGVGTIGQVLAKQAVKNSRAEGRSVKVVGVDIVPEAIEDAKQNAASNFEASDSVQLEFVAGKAEEVVHKLIAENLAILQTSEVLCVVDPPRAGLHPSVLRCLRNTDQIDRIIYVSCNWESLAKDLASLCEYLSDSADDEGVSAPFRLVRVQPVDMFPLTEHCEMLVELVRS
jgi:tRNA (uracil-5-)-methyltransferase